MRLQRHKRRRAALAMELLLALPILMTVVLGMVQFSLLISARQIVTVAAREGGRVAALGGTQEEIQAAVDRSIGCQVAQVQAAIDDAAGDPIDAGEPVTVVVRVRTSCLVPELLSFAGISFRNQEMVARAVLRKE